MANEIKIDLTLTGEQPTARGLKNVGDAAEKAGDGLEGMGKDASFLDKRVKELQGSLKDLFAEFAKTGDKDILAKIKVDQRELSQLTRLKKQFSQAGSGFAGDLIESFSKSMSAGGTKVVAAVVGAVAAAAPFLGATLASAVVGTTGLAGIAGGIAMAARDERVKAAATSLGHTFMREFGAASEPFIGATVGALQHLETATMDITAKLGPEFEGLADHVIPLADALGGLVDKTLPGLKKGFQAADAVLGALERGLPELGEDLSAMFESMAEDPEAAAAALHDLLAIIGETARGIGQLTHFLTSYYEVLIKVGEVTTGWANDMPDWVRAITPLSAVADYFDQADGAMKDAAQTAPSVTGNLFDVGEAAEETAGKVRTLNDAIDDQIRAMDKWFGRFMDSQEVASNYQAAIDDLTESVKKNGKVFDLDSEEGRANAAALRDVAEAIKEIRNNTIETTGNVQAANEVYYQQVEALRQQAIRLGMSKQAASEMAAALLAIPTKVDVEVRASGLLEAIARAQQLNRLLGGAAAGARARPITIDGHFYPGDDSGYGGGRAGGGDMVPGKWYTVGENGVEVVSMKAGGGATVYNNKQTQSMMSGASGGAAMVAPQLNLNVQVERTGDRLADVLMQMLAYELRFTGGLIGEYRIPPATT